AAPRAAAEHALGPGRAFPGAAVGRRALVGLVVPVPDPFPGVARHVAEALLGVARGARADRPGGVVPAPGAEHGVVAGRVLVAPGVLLVLAGAPRRVFPLRLAGQPAAGPPREGVR